MNTDTDSLHKDQYFQARVLEESNHRVRNNLAMICALLEMEMLQAPENERRRLRISLARTRSLALPHELTDSSSGKVEVAILTHAVIDNVRSLYGQVENNVNIICTSPIYLDTHCATYLALVITELAAHIIDCSSSSCMPWTLATSIENSDKEIHLSIECGCSSKGDECPGIDPLSWNILKGLIERSLGGRLELPEGRPFRALIHCPLPH